MYPFREIELIVRAAGIENFGVIPFPEVKDHLLFCRNLDNLPSDSQTVIIAAFPIKIETPERNVARVAAIPDYHKVIGGILEKACESLRAAYPGYIFVHFVDNSPIPEASTAAEAGLGYIGRHGLLITEKYGTWVVLGDIVTNLPIERTVPAQYKKQCENCNRCRDICPLGALGGEEFRRDLCISRIMQKDGVFTQKEIEAVKQAGSCWGCDLCQEVCPQNTGKPDTPIEEFYKDFIPVVSIDELGVYPDRVFSWRKPGVIRRNLETLNS